MSWELPPGVFDARQIQSNEFVDVCVVGSGPGGSAAARTLARKGFSVLVLEAGEYHPVASFTNNTLDGLKKLYFNHGKKITDGNAKIAYMLGKGLGGGTLVNSGISFRPPSHTLEEWALKKWTNSTLIEDLRPYLEEAERTLYVETLTLDRLGPNNRVFAEGLQKLGWSGSVIPRNTRGCMPCARCFFGCPSGAKQSTDKNFLPQAVEAGARIYVNAFVNKISGDNGTVDRILVQSLDPKTQTVQTQFEVKAKKIILAAGAVGTARILLNSRLANSSGQVGQNFRCHPTAGVLGYFEEKIEGYKSILQGYFCDEFFGDGILLETAWAPLDAVAALLPGVGNDWRQNIQNINHYAMCGGMIKEHGSGQVTVDSSGRARVKYNLETEDLIKLTRVLYHSAEIMLAAGARYVDSDNPVAPRMTSLAQVRQLSIEHPNLGASIAIEGNHAQGTCRMNPSAKLGVVDEFGRSHDCKNLWIMDSSVFPEALGVNPQITICALALRNAERIERDS